MQTPSPDMVRTAIANAVSHLDKALTRPSRFLRDSTVLALMENDVGHARLALRDVVDRSFLDPIRSLSRSDLQDSTIVLRIRDGVVAALGTLRAMTPA